MEFRILGPLEVRDGDRTVALGGAKRRALLAMLLLHANEPVSAERLAVVVWGAETAADAVKTVRVHVSRIRAALRDPDALTTTAAGYRLRVRAGELDAARFARALEEGRERLAAGAPARAAEILRAALCEWRGDVLADLRYEAFAQTTIARLEELRWDAIELRNDADLELGRADAVLAELEARADEAPLRERLVEQQMRALYAVGRHVEALAVYREAQRRLDAELGLRPGPALRALERSVLSHAETLNARRSGAPPAPATATVGRDGDIGTVGKLLEQRRLVTLTGPGGVGKTRLAVEVARTFESRFGDGVHVASLARVGTAAEVPAALVRAVAATVQPGERDEEALARRLAGAEALLMIDNVEHVLDAAPLIGELVAACPRLRVLATSREPLCLRGEQCLPVAPLAESDAIALFVDRARERRPDFGLTDANTPAVAELCRRLDGLPLAIELAAGRSALLAPEDLVARLADVLPLLEAGPRDAPARQRTMRATLEWSYALLDRDEQQALRRLGVFVGGCDLEAAQAVTRASIGVLDSLVAKSLAQVRDHRLRLLEVVRQFATDALGDSPDASRARHAEHYLALAERLGRRLRMTGLEALVPELERELGNLRAAFDHVVAEGDGEKALRLAAALEPYWVASSRPRDGAALVDEALALAAGTSDRARGRARLARANLLRRLELEQSVEDADVALALCTAADDLEGRCLALDIVVSHAGYFGDRDRARVLADQERALAERLGEPYYLALATMRRVWAARELEVKRALAAEAIPRLRACGNLAGVLELSAGLTGDALKAHDYEAAAEAAEAGLSAARELGAPMALEHALNNVALAALFLGVVDRAGPVLREQVEISRREHVEWSSAEPVILLACVAAHAGAWERAAMLSGYADAMTEIPLADGERPVREALIAKFIPAARAALGDSAWRRAAATGAAMTLDELLDLALGSPAAV